MEILENVNARIAKNLTYYRKAANLTQAELAEKINYSDKSVSKWESGNGVPDIYILLRLAELYGVTVNDLVSDEPKTKKSNRDYRWRIPIILLSSGLVWLVAVIAFVTLNLLLPHKGEWWIAFLCAVPVNAILLISLSGAWKYKVLNVVSVSILIWSGFACLYVIACVVRIRLGYSDNSGMWLVFLIAIPLQVLEILWGWFRFTLFKGGAGKKEKKQKKDKGEGGTN